VLLVEDQHQVRSLLVSVLETAGYRVLAAADGEAAAALADDHPLDLMLTDVVMPGVSGPELARELRRDRPDLSVVYMSGYAAGGLPGAGDPGAGDAFLQKPFSMQELLTAVRDALDVEPVRR
jgi:two-component system, cell cycle sensor histidine kinase and response regulator CckA